MLDVLVKSIAEEKAKHITAAVTGSTGLAVAKMPPPDSTFSTLITWLPHLAVFAAFAVSCIVFYKTYLDIKLTKRKLEELE